MGSGRAFGHGNPKCENTTQVASYFAISLKSRVRVSIELDVPNPNSCTAVQPDSQGNKNKARNGVIHPSLGG